jgi:hypothetical protein
MIFYIIIVKYAILRLTLGSMVATQLGCKRDPPSMQQFTNNWQLEWGLFPAATPQSPRIPFADALSSRLARDFPPLTNTSKKTILRCRFRGASFDV